MNVARYRVRTSVFVAAYQQAPSSEVPFIKNLKQSRGLIVSPNQYRQAYYEFRINEDIYQL
jgi:hypothetical protein